MLQVGICFVLFCAVFVGAWMLWKKPTEQEGLPDHMQDEPEQESKQLSPDTQPEKAYDFTKQVPESTPVDKSYFHDAVFLGDSRTEDFILYAGLADTNAYAKMGLNVRSVFTDPVIELNGETLTVMDAVAKTAFTKAYLMFGINELGWVYPEIFIQEYSKVIDRIREINPEAMIYVQPVLPVTKNHKVGDENNERIAAFNALIRQMVVEKKVYFVNVSEAVVDKEGCLPDDAASDGVHLKKEYCKKWLQYLQTHVITK